MILGIALFPVFGMGGILFPLLARAFGLLATIVGVYSVRADENEDPMNGLNRGYLVTTILAMIRFASPCSCSCARSRGRRSQVSKFYLFLAGLIGIATAYAFVWITQYYTEYRYRRGARDRQRVRSRARRPTSSPAWRSDSSARACRCW